MLTQYDEYPVHQAAYPFSEIPSTDYNWDDGYFFGIYNAEEQIFLYSGMRVNPNNDMLGGYAGVNIAGQQYTARFSRPWRQNCDTVLGPLSYDFVKPLEEVKLLLEENDSDFTFDLQWIGAGPCYEEPHHVAWSRGRRTTDQTRYYQSGYATGWFELRGKRYELSGRDWAGSRDHSWGLYAQRAPLHPDPQWLTPREVPSISQGMRWASWWTTESDSGFYSVHESEDGEQLQMNDVFGTPLEGGVDIDASGEHLNFVKAEHEMEFIEGTRILKKGVWRLTDEAGGLWVQTYVPTSSWHPLTIGYGAGSFKDGGSMFTYHGVEGLVQEWDDFDFSTQPYDHTMYNGDVMKGVHSPEYLAEVTTVSPTGTELVGSAHIELFIHAKYAPYGFENPS